MMSLEAADLAWAEESSNGNETNATGGGSAQPAGIRFVRHSTVDSKGSSVTALQITGGSSYKEDLDKAGRAPVASASAISETPLRGIDEPFMDTRRFLMEDSDANQWRRLCMDDDDYDEGQEPDLLVDNQRNGGGVGLLMNMDQQAAGGRHENAALLASEFDEGVNYLAGQLHFPRVDSDQILYQLPRKGPKIIGGKYLIGDMLGEGSYGKVKEAMDCDTLCRRAVKILKQTRLRKIPYGEQDVQREIRLLHRLHHRNVIQLFEVIYNQEKKKMYLFMEYCVGSLQEMLDTAPGKRFPVWQSHRYFVQLIDGLEYLHSRSIVHKDIKPGNLLLIMDETLKICDLGVAEELDKYCPDDTSYVGRGTPKFQPPEIAIGQSRFSGFAVDVWSAGVTLYNFASGLYPFEGENVYKLYDNISKNDVVIPADVDSCLEDLLRGMLRKTPSERLSLFAIRSHSWTTRKHPLTLDGVPLPAYKGDPLRHMTIYGCLEAVYGGSQSQTSSLNHSMEAVISERDLRRRVSVLQHQPTTNVHIHASEPNCSAGPCHAAAAAASGDSGNRGRSFFSSIRRFPHVQHHQQPSASKTVRKSSSEPHTNRLNTKLKHRINVCKVQ